MSRKLRADSSVAWRRGRMTSSGLNDPDGLLSFFQQHLGRLKKEDSHFKTMVVYAMSSRCTWTTWRSFAWTSKTKQIANNNNNNHKPSEN